MFSTEFKEFNLNNFISIYISDEKVKNLVSDTELFFFNKKKLIILLNYLLLQYLSRINILKLLFVY
jgi:hypothetical protein